MSNTNQAVAIEPWRSGRKAHLTKIYSQVAPREQYNIDRIFRVNQNCQQAADGTFGLVTGINIPDRTVTFLSNQVFVKVPIKYGWFGIVTDNDTRHPAPDCFGVLTQDWTDPNDSRISVTKNALVKIREVHSDGMTARIEFPDGRTCWVPGGLVWKCEPVITADNVVRFREAYKSTKQGNTFDVQKGAQGRISGKPSGNNVPVRLDTDKSRIVQVDARALKYGATTSEMKIVADKGLPRPGTKAKVDPHQINRKSDLKHHVEYLLGEIYRDFNKVRGLSNKHMIAIDTQAKRSRLATMAQEGVQLAAPSLLNKFKNANGFTLGDILASSRPVLKSNHTPGLYLRAYRDPIKRRPTKAVTKETQEQLKGKTKWFPYFGSTQDQAKRDESHGTTAASSGHGSFNCRHYRIARACETKKVVQVFEMPAKYLDVGHANQAELELLENVFILKFKTYANTVASLSTTEKVLSTDQEETEDYISSSFPMKEVASGLSIIAERCFKLTDWPLRGLQHLSDVADGLNISSPLSVFSCVKDPILFTKLHITGPEGRMVYRRKSKALYAPRAKGHTDGAGGGSFVLVINGVSFPMDTKTTDLQRKDDRILDLHIEIMDEHAGPHLCPYFVAPDACPWDNLVHLRRLAMAISYKANNGQKVKTFVRAPEKAYALNKAWYPGQAEGASLHGKVTSLMAFLLGDTVQDLSGEPMVNSVDLGVARIMELKFDRFKGEIHTSWSVPQGKVRTVRCSRAVGKQAMIGRHIENVGGPFGRIDTNGLEQFAKRNNMGGSALYRMKQRASCDRCFIIYTGLSHDTSCVRKEGTQTCVACEEAYLPCSWTGSEKLKGLDLVSGDKRLVSSKESERTFNLLARLRYDDALHQPSLSTRPVLDDTIDTVQVTAENSHDLNEITVADLEMEAALRQEDGDEDDD